MNRNLIIFVLLFATVSYAELIKVNPGKYFDYYHMQYELKSGEYTVNKNYGFNQGGQFEVLVPKQFFPISAPNCKKNIIIRMPASDTEEQKKALYEKLMAGKSVVVTLELNPYVNIINESPLKLELQYCNVFFRQKLGNYYDRL
ncbi:hypothetical protein [Endozoicomonas sp. ONNA1]|uniref:hypothetical protein n=1 Tax=Endozoicomonas sp. ONNA1 TaxID=2828740 RepID=UPI002147A960|nr:hypothetical protein [Endozoicomonas sp. ONNA1]